MATQTQARPTQHRRHIAIATPLGEDVLLLNRFTLRERLSAPFEIEADLCSLDHNLDYRKVVGHVASIRLNMGTHNTRYFHGHVSRFVQTGGQGHYARYRATIVPWMWFLTRTSDCRIFQRQSVPDLAEEVFNGHRFGSEFYEPRLKSRYPKRRYCVQYRETDFNFINRLLESEGIYYWFEHTEKRHRLILADAIGASKTVEGFEKLQFNVAQPGPAAGRTDITEWLVQQEVQPVSYHLKDFDFKKPSDPLLASHETPREHGMARFAMYDYPGEHYEEDAAKRNAQLRIEELQAGHEIVQGTTAARGLSVGQVFQLQKHPRDDQNRKYLITDLTLTADAGEFETNNKGEEFFSCHFSAIPHTTPYRPPRVTAKPIIQGVQTATVVGQKGKEVDPDEFGRVKVHFHWDRYGQMDENSSCWVRVAQPWAGKGFGGMNIPRIGQEVIVDFLEGDPDRPIINGRIYNAESMPNASNAGRDGKKGNAKPSGISQAAMMTSFKSNSFGGSGGSNEITMNDEGEKEGLFLKAQKDEIHNVGNDREDIVGNNETRKVSVDRTREVGNNESVKIGVNETREVGTNRDTKIGANETIKIGANASETVAVAKVIDVGTTLMIKAGTSITLSCGASTIHMNAAGFITISGTVISTAAAVNASVVAPMTEIVGGALLTLAGAVIMEKGGIIRIDGSSLMHVGGSKVEIVGSGETIVQGAPVKVN